MTKPTKWHMRPAKTQISLGIRPVWSESSLSAWRKPGPLATLWSHSRLWSDWADSQADLSLGWAHMPFCWFCHEAAHYCYNLRHSEIGFISRIYRNDLKYSNRQVWANTVDPHETSSWRSTLISLHCLSFRLHLLHTLLYDKKKQQQQQKKTNMIVQMLEQLQHFCGCPIFLSVPVYFSFIVYENRNKSIPFRLHLPTIWWICAWDLCDIKYQRDIFPSCNIRQ